MKPLIQFLARSLFVLTLLILVVSFWFPMPWFLAVLALAGVCGGIAVQIQEKLDKEEL